MKGMNIWLQLGLALLTLFAILALVYGVLSYRRAQAVAVSEEDVECLVALDAARIERGRAVYGTHCAACHGADLKGSPHWETRLADGSYLPPPLNAEAHAWQHSDASLVKTIAQGRNPGKLSPMPAFGGILSPDETRAVVEFIKSHWRAGQLNQQDLLNP